MKTTTKYAAATAAIFAAPTAFAADKAEVQFWHAMGGQLGEITDKFADDFNAQSDSCVINSTYKGNYTENMTAAIAAFRANEQPHIVQVFEVGTATMMAAGDKGAIYPVYKLMEDAGIEFDQSKYLPAVISYYTDTDGNLLSLPFNSSTPVLWYNKTALDAAGVAVPTTWDEVEEVARALKANGVEKPFSFGWQSWSNLENYSAWHNIDFGSEENGFAGLSTEFTFNNDAVVNHIQRIADMGKEGLFVYGGRRGDSRGQFVNGETALWINSSAYYGGFKNDIKDFEFGQTMLPLDSALADAPQNSIIGGATLWVLNGHEQPEYKCAAEFFQFLSEPEQQANWHQTTGYVPITTAAYELSKEQGFYETDPGTDTAIKQLSLNEPTPASKGLRFGNFVQIRDVINEELEAVWSGEKDAQTAMDDAVERGNALLRKFQDANS
ncbi:MULTISPECIES: sn-glycerol-3-phosphate ABC transporter substrate-binding protein UgpB [unclassified Ruegeria]|uniref:sn-glycerol-3-phosphate ABC transporter substrate-binding protein UgpB n=1 Tax=unclassified Ruegeria TaxID=2625375 RepID=UPI0014895550|nr:MULTISPECIES: sn-glycerol-3-phosphate ABC transporter substrate-binding protein UgpB [unclassified Ruegeria]NOD76671.1 sn-glycerol-3-phosphate ABC transporter substrate-binding protein UgpB [Ruegeria sp. HKCCD4332]NOD89391.1 sn-glycerol-3-phosphate ABC transporter substrate-binding protein UgpB [Ruegeria sp. HKCCD4318]NOE13446.1 sn-glycerol-3-phosphate ABC transporter substrate-binding protein UgpB [Ruegeria sp. HKCCD4318-2]NOG07805.1 sn-glycerol-3-phosphate ABC transporter substrate-binding